VNTKIAFTLELLVTPGAQRGWWVGRGGRGVVEKVVFLNQLTKIKEKYLLEHPQNLHLILTTFNV